MSMKKFYVGVKGIIREDRGILLIKHSEGHWDIPGGRMDDDEDFSDTLGREISEELPGSELVSVSELLGTFRLHKDIDGDISLVLIYFLVEAKIPNNIVFSGEHVEHLWIKLVSDIPADVNPEMSRILRELINS